MIGKNNKNTSRIKGIYPMGGGVWIVVPEAKETEKILGFNVGKPFEVMAKTEEEAIKKAEKKLKGVI